MQVLWKEESDVVERPPIFSEKVSRRATLVCATISLVLVAVALFIAVEVPVWLVVPVVAATGGLAGRVLPIKKIRSPYAHDLKNRTGKNPRPQIGVAGVGALTLFSLVSAIAGQYSMLLLVAAAAGFMAFVAGRNRLEFLTWGHRGE